MRKVILGLAIATVALGQADRASANAADDRAAAQHIAENMKTSGQLKDYRVGVKFQDGVAWLMGTVTSPEQKVIAEQIARETPGVDRIISKLEVTGGAEQPSDSIQTAGGQYQDQGQFQQAAAATPMAMPMRGAPQQRVANSNMPVPYARTMQGNVQQANYGGGGYCPPGGEMGGAMGGPMGGAPGMAGPPGSMGVAPAGVTHDNPQMPGYAWPSYAAYPNYAALTYPKQYSAAAWPYIGPFYPYPQVPLGWRKVTLEWDDGWWMLDFKDCKDCH
jgi:hypothetical protein